MGRYQVMPDLSEEEYEQLKASIAEHGVLVPIELDEVGAVLDGHWRMRACKELGIEDYPRITRVGFTEPEKIAHAWRLNLERRHLSKEQRSEFWATMRAGGMSYRAIAEVSAVSPSTVLDALAGVQFRTPDAVIGRDGKVYKPAIYTRSERATRNRLAIADELSGRPDLAAKVDAGDMPANRAIRQVRDEQRQKECSELVEFSEYPGYSANIQLIHGDMLEVVPTLGLFDLIIADPPYGVTDWAWDALRGSEYIANVRNWLAVLNAARNPARSHLFWFCSPRLATDTELVMRELGMPITSRIVWHRRNMAMGSHATDRFVDSWDMILHCGNGSLYFPVEWSEAWFDVQTFAVPQTNFTDAKVHPTQKPQELINRLVSFGSAVGGRVLDPFAGSGVTGVACMDSRECVLVEMEGEYANIIRNRLHIV